MLFSLGFSTVSPCFSLYISVHIPFHALCIISYLYFICILHVTLRECHSAIKGYLINYLLTYYKHLLIYFLNNNNHFLNDHFIQKRAEQ